MNRVNDYIRVVMNKNRRKIFHVAAWAAFIAYELLTIHFVVGRMSTVSDYATHYALNMLLFYVNAYIVTRNQQQVNKLFLMTFEVITYIFLNYILNIELERNSVAIQRPTTSISPFIIASFWRCLYFVGLSSVYGFAVNLIRSRLRINALQSFKLQQEKDQLVLEKNLLLSENNYLRAQINPHLFFNTLNFVYNSVYKVSPKAGEAVMLLSDITRYSISSTDENGLVYVADELINVKNLIALNQLRFNHQLHIRTEFDERYNDAKIIPLVLLTLVENIFKYGDLSDPSYPAVIRFELTSETIQFSTFNKKRSDAARIKGNGLGLDNTRRRLEGVYPDQFSLSVKETDSFYTTYLAIQTYSACLIAI